jgi:hypothetical protein
MGWQPLDRHLLAVRQHPKSGIQLAAAGKKGYVERVTRTIKEEEQDLSKYLDFADDAFQIRHFIEDVYMT